MILAGVVEQIGQAITWHNQTMLLSKYLNKNITGKRRLAEDNLLTAVFMGNSVSKQPSVERIWLAILQQLFVHSTGAYGE